VKIFLDVNVIVAVLNREYPLFTPAARILSLSDNKRFQIYTSPLCLAIAYYFAEKKSSSKHARSGIEILAGKLIITTVNQETVRLSVKNPAITDFEDGLEYYSAVQSGCQAIITEDVSDFFFSKIPVMNCETFILSLISQK